MPDLIPACLIKLPVRKQLTLACEFLYFKLKLRPIILHEPCGITIECLDDFESLPRT